VTTPPPGWHPLLPLGPSTWLGEVGGDQGSLWTGDDVEPFRQLDLDQPVACLPLLERSLDDVLTDVTRAEDMCRPATGRALRRLVPAVVVETALRSESGHWLDGACRWLGAMPPSDRTARWARAVESSSAASQATRHEARRVRRRWSVR
jgi:hypothetical protein